MLADVSEEYSDSILHVTTRQISASFCAHGYAHPHAAAGVGGHHDRAACATRCGNVTAARLAGVCHTEAFDCDAYAKAGRVPLGHPDTQDFGAIQAGVLWCEQEAWDW